MVALRFLENIVSVFLKITTKNNLFLAWYLLLVMNDADNQYFEEIYIWIKAENPGVKIGNTNYTTNWIKRELSNIYRLVLIGCYLWHVTNQVELWAGHHLTTQKECKTK